ncbi:thioredoxin [Amaricoccus tamworthensis]|uniref:thioredoxin n=1 Tax=Amaricoccus tamworthensis TaxID=57002 RepID=UPI003C7A2C41
MEINLTPPDTADLIKDSSEATFMADVVEASREVPVIVDFWAPWCGPCKTLGPALEAAVTAARGKVKMVKVDVDQNQRIAAQMQIQSIPAVFAFVNGQPVDGFMGAKSPAELKAFVEKLASMSNGGGGGLEEAVEAADEMLAEGAIADAAQTYSAILAEDKENLGAISGMAKAYIAMEDLERAKSILEMAPADKQGDPLIAGVLAQIELAEAGADAGETAELERALEADPNNHQARFDLAIAYMAKDKPEEAVEALLELFRRDREWNDAAAKEQLFKIFDSLGPKSDLAKNGRRKLSSLIFA